MDNGLRHVESRADFAGVEGVVELAGLAGGLGNLPWRTVRACLAARRMDSHLPLHTGCHMYLRWCSLHTVLGERWWGPSSHTCCLMPALSSSEAAEAWAEHMEKRSGLAGCRQRCRQPRARHMGTLLTWDWHMENWSTRGLMQAPKLVQPWSFADWEAAGAWAPLQIAADHSEYPGVCQGNTAEVQVARIVEDTLRWEVDSSLAVAAAVE